MSHVPLHTHNVYSNRHLKGHRTGGQEIAQFTLFVLFKSVASFYFIMQYTYTVLSLNFHLILISLCQCHQYQMLTLNI